MAARAARRQHSDLSTLLLLAAALILTFVSPPGGVVEGFRFGRLPRQAEDRGRLTLRIFRFGRRAEPPPPVVASPSSPPPPPQPQQSSVARVDEGAPEKDGKGGGEQELARRYVGHTCVDHWSASR